MKPNFFACQAKVRGNRSPEPDLEINLRRIRESLIFKIRNFPISCLRGYGFRGLPRRRFFCRSAQLTPRGIETHFGNAFLKYILRIYVPLPARGFISPPLIPGLCPGYEWRGIKLLCGFGRAVVYLPAGRPGGESNYCAALAAR